MEKIAKGLEMRGLESMTSPLADFHWETIPELQTVASVSRIVAASATLRLPCRPKTATFCASQADTAKTFALVTGIVTCTEAYYHEPGTTCLSFQARISHMMEALRPL